MFMDWGIELIDRSYLRVRLRIALWFVGLSSIAYLAPTLLSGMLFYYSLTAGLDHELNRLGSSIGHAIDLRNGIPHFRDWARIVQTNPKRSLYSIQLYDASKRFVEQYGVPGIPRLLHTGTETHEGELSMRCFVSPLTMDKTVVGYLQLQISTADRDSAMRTFAFVMTCMGPFVLLGLGVCSIFVADKATVSIRNNLNSLRHFIEDAGHELSTPLSIITASSEALHRKFKTQQLSFHDLDVIISSADRMQKIIDDMGLLTEIEQPLLNAGSAKNVDLGAILDDCINDFASKFEQKRIEIVWSNSESTIVLGNQEALRRMFYNLIENAYKYTNSGGRVAVSLEHNNGKAIVTIADTGIGIEKEDLGRVFDRFFRADASRTRSSGGSGLGLAIVKAIAMAHDAEITVESEQHQGSKFVVRVPIKDANQLS